MYRAMILWFLWRLARNSFADTHFLEMATRNGIRRAVGMVLVFCVRQTAEAVAGMWESSC